MIVERTYDWELIKKIGRDPRVYPAISDDFSPASEDWNPIQDEAACYLLVRDESGPFGFFALMPENGVCWKVHTCLLPRAYGRPAGEAARAATDWVWKNTRCVRVTTDIPEFNRLALRYALASGMTEFGRNRKSYMKHGQLYDVIMLGMSKGGL